MSRRTLLLVFCLALVPYAWLTYRFDWVCDDAFISFRYSKHLAAGHGLRFNAGEQPPVEGYSNFLWVLVLTPFEAAGVPAAGPARLLSVACGVALLFRLAAYLARSGLAAPPLAATLLIYATLPAVALWSTSGLAAMPFALLVFLAFETLGRPDRALPAALVCAGLVLIRAEGFAWALVLIAVAGLEALIRKDRSRRAPLLAAGAAAVAAVAAALAMLVFRLAYFGYPLPNTAYAKVGFSLPALERGARYAGSFLLTFPHLALILLAGVALALNHRSSRAALRQPLLIAGAFFAYAVAVGGDFMPMGRMLVPALPFLALVLAALVREISNRAWLGGLTAACVACSLAPAFDLHPVPREVRRQLSFRWNIEKFDSEYRQWRRMRKRVALGEELGRALTAHTRPGESLPYGRIGAVAYFSHLFILDQNGLVNLEVARGEVQQLRSAGHDKTVPPHFFLKDRPDYYRAKISRRPTGDPRLEKASAALLSDLPAAERDRYNPEIIPLEPRAGKPRSLLLARRSP